jgi:hypothetical protein
MEANTMSQELLKVPVIRQGDLLFFPQSDVPKHILDHFEEKSDGIQKDGVIQEGEATGHHHRVAVLEDAEVLRFPYGTNETYVKVGPNGVAIVHEEHGPVTLAPNTTYRVHRAREYDYVQGAARYMED